MGYQYKEIFNPTNEEKIFLRLEKILAEKDSKLTLQKYNNLVDSNLEAEVKELIRILNEQDLEQAQKYLSAVDNT